MAFTIMGTYIGSIVNCTVPSKITRSTEWGPETVDMDGAVGRKGIKKNTWVGTFIKHGPAFLGVLADLTSGIAIVIIGGLALAHVISLPFSAALACTIIGGIYIPLTLIIVTSSSSCLLFVCNDNVCSYETDSDDREQ